MVLNFEREYCLEYMPVCLKSQAMIGKKKEIRGDMFHKNGTVGQ